MTEQTQSKILDSVAMEALSAGIGLGTVKARQAKRVIKTAKTVKTGQPNKMAVAVEEQSSEPTVTKRRWFRTIVAYLLDLLIIGGSLLIAIGVAHFATVEQLPMPAEYLFIVANRFEPQQIAVGALLLLIAYFILFKFLVGVTLGETLARAKVSKQL